MSQVSKGTQGSNFSAAANAKFYNTGVNFNNNSKLPSATTTESTVNTSS